MVSHCPPMRIERRAVLAGLALILAAIAGCGQQESAAEQLAKKLRSDDSRVRYRAVKELAELGAEGFPAAKALGEALSDKDEQIRYFAVEPKRAEKIESIDLVKGTDITSPVIMSVTVETR